MAGQKWRKVDLCIVHLHLCLCFLYGFLHECSWKCEQNQRKPLITESLKWVVVRAPTTVPSISPPLHRTSQMRNVSVVHQSRLVSTVKWARQWAYSWTGHPLDLYHPKKGLLWRWETFDILCRYMQWIVEKKKKKKILTFFEILLCLMFVILWRQRRTKCQTWRREWSILLLFFTNTRVTEASWRKQTSEHWSTTRWAIS